MEPIQYRWDPQKPSLLKADFVKPGLYNLTLLDLYTDNHEPLGIDAWIVVAQETEHDEVRNAFDEAVHLTKRWGQEVRPDAVRSFRRAYLLVLSKMESEPRIAQLLTITQDTAGSCSPAVGQAGGDVTITCYGVDPKAQKKFHKLIDIQTGGIQEKIREANKWADRYRNIKKRLQAEVKNKELLLQALELLKAGNLTCPEWFVDLKNRQITHNILVDIALKGVPEDLLAEGSTQALVLTSQIEDWLDDYLEKEKTMSLKVEDRILWRYRSCMVSALTGEKAAILGREKFVRDFNPDMLPIPQYIVRGDLEFSAEPNHGGCYRARLTGLRVVKVHGNENKIKSQAQIIKSRSMAATCARLNPLGVARLNLFDDLQNSMAGPVGKRIMKAIQSL